MDTVKIDKRTKNGKPLDIKQVFQLKAQGLNNVQIGTITGYHESYVGRVIKKFNAIIDDQDILDTYQGNRSNVLSAIELKLLDNLTDEDKLKSASLNNVAYAMTQTSQLRRLEMGQSSVNIGISVEHKLAKALEKSRSTDDNLNPGT